MIWKIPKKPDKEYTYKKCFAFFPRVVDGYIVWLSPYYKTWDYSEIIYEYCSHLFVFEKDVINYIENKKEIKKARAKELEKARMRELKRVKIHYGP